MSWLRLDDGFTHHPKFAGWSDAQKWAWLEVMEYCARYDTGGRIPIDVRLLPQKRPRTILKLAENSGWIERKRGTQGDELWIHDWAIYNVDDSGKSARQARWRARKRLHVDVSEASTRVDNVDVSRSRGFSSPSPYKPLGVDVDSTARARSNDGAAADAARADVGGAFPPAQLPDAVQRRQPPPPDDDEREPEALARLRELASTIGLRLDPDAPGGYADDGGDDEPDA